MIFDNDCANRFSILKTIFMKCCPSKSWRFLPQRSFFQYLLPFPSAICWCISAQTLCPATILNVSMLLFSSGVTNLSLLVGVCAACILAYRCLQMKWWAAVTVVAIRSSKALLMCPYVSYGKFSVLAPRCSCALLHNLQPTPDHCVIFASNLATGINPAIAIISRFSVSRRRVCRTCLRTLCFHFAVTWSPTVSAVHVPCAAKGLMLSCSALARTHNFQEFSVINPSVLLQDLHHAVVRYLISLLVCAVLYVICKTTRLFLTK